MAKWMLRGQPSVTHPCDGKKLIICLNSTKML